MTNEQIRNQRRLTARRGLIAKVQDVRNLQPWSSDAERDRRLKAIRRMQDEIWSIESHVCPHDRGTPEWKEWWASNG
jgi:hypothetical protein